MRCAGAGPRNASANESLSALKAWSHLKRPFLARFLAASAALRDAATAQRSASSWRPR